MCNPNPCQNGGTCNDRSELNRVECVCPPGFIGSKCENNINECESNPCKNNGICIDGPNNYTCNCSQTGYTGTNCEENINECNFKPCLNQGICFDTYGSYICQCPPGYDGLNCNLVSIIYLLILNVLQNFTLIILECQ